MMTVCSRAGIREQAWFRFSRTESALLGREDDLKERTHVILFQRSAQLLDFFMGESRLDTASGSIKEGLDEDK